MDQLSAASPLDEFPKSVLALSRSAIKKSAVNALCERAAAGFKERQMLWVRKVFQPRATDVSQ
jgi:hypothetical protein